MKLTTTNGTVTVTSESKKEAIRLFSYALEYQNQQDTSITPSLLVYSPRKRKKIILTQRCRYCGKVCLKGQGVASHERACLRKQTSEQLSKIPEA